MNKAFIPDFGSRLHKNIVAVPEVINECSGLRVFGQLLKSFIFSTDVAIIATGGKTDGTIRLAIESGANAISYTPPSTGDLFKEITLSYRSG
jgi:hypothetical protein